MLYGNPYDMELYMSIHHNLLIQDPTLSVVEALLTGIPSYKRVSYIEKTQGIINSVMRYAAYRVEEGNKAILAGDHDESEEQTRIEVEHFASRWIDCERLKTVLIELYTDNL